MTHEPGEREVIVITGAAGRIGAMLRPRLAGAAGCSGWSTSPR